MNKYTVELYKDGRRVDVQTTNEEGWAKCTVEIDDYTYGVEVQINEFEPPYCDEATATFFTINLKSIPYSIILDTGYGLAFWNSALRVDTGVVVRRVGAE